jgi:parallel beta-helix repeat protein
MSPFPGDGVHSINTDIVIKNSIVWYNEGTPILIVGAASKSPVIYSDVERGFLGQGNINLDPLFAPTDVPDYHLQSIYGRWDPRAGKWVIDTNHSPCIDAGDPQDPVGQEPAPNGGRINMGAYGGTSQASKGMSHLVYHVDGINGNDSNNGLSRAKALATIRKAITIARDGDIIMVWPGVYEEEITFNRKAITVQSAADAAAVVARGGYAFSFYGAESSSSVLRNFVIRNCGEGAIFCQSASPTLTNLTIVDNQFGIAAYAGADPNITNCIFWSNDKGDLFDCKARYSCIENKVGGEGNISKDPLFAEPQNNDYHLQSRFGRYWPQHDVWVIDDDTSPCIDAGDPKIYPVRERMPNGGRMNMGAYGGTPYASMSDWPLKGDVNRDGVVNMKDFAAMAENWLDAMPWAGKVMPGNSIVSPVDGLAIPAIIDIQEYEFPAWEMFDK